MSLRRGTRAGTARERGRTIDLGVGRPVFLATGATDLRRGVHALYALILDIRPATAQE